MTWARRRVGRTLLYARQRTRAARIWAFANLPRRKKITAMVRIRNEAEFLEASILSILDIVDRVVIVDNQSDDQTPAIISKLVEQHPKKIESYIYPHTILRVGVENEQGVAADQNAPNLLSTYYNFCLSKCRTSFVLKWDGDMVATKSFADDISDFRSSDALVYYFRGANVHPSGTTVIAGRPWKFGDHRELYDNWVDSFTDFEPRLFPRYGASYDNRLWWCECLSSPFPLLDFACRGKYAKVGEKSAYAHLKYCKKDPFANLSPEFAEGVKARLGTGDPVEPEIAECLRKWKLGPEVDQEAGHTAAIV